MTRLLTALLPLLLAYTTFVIGNEWERLQLGAPEGADCVAAQHGRVPAGELGAVGGGLAVAVVRGNDAVRAARCGRGGGLGATAGAWRGRPG